MDAIDAGLRLLQADIEAAFLTNALDHLGIGGVDTCPFVFQGASKILICVL